MACAHRNSRAVSSSPQRWSGASGAASFRAEAQRRGAAQQRVLDLLMADPDPDPDLDLDSLAPGADSRLETLLEHAGL